MMDGMNVPEPTMHPCGRREAEYRVVELSVVTDEELTRVLNAETAAGWLFESVQFAMWPGSKRPAMAFLIFIRPLAEGSSA